jgi:cholesterol oxidase
MLSAFLFAVLPLSAQVVVVPGESVAPLSLPAQQAPSGIEPNYGAPMDFDVIVVGSGYGGSVATLRLAEAGQKVAVLERGRRHAMGSFPRGEEAFWEPDHGRFGTHNFRDLGNNVGWIGSGVGGGSLVNASIMLRKTDFTGFPAGIDARSLSRFYDRVEDMLDAKPFPVDDPSSPHFNTPKTRALMEAARRLGKKPVMPKLAVLYRENGEPVGTVRANKHGALQQGCRGCGECSLPGCNYGAKNTLDLNYLHRAEKVFGARILPQRETDKIEPLEGGGYRVHYKDPATGEEGSYTAKALVLAAGALGSTELLLRNRDVHGTLTRLSDRLGESYTTNGNFIGFAIGASQPIHPSLGPEITTGLEFDGLDGKGQGFHIFDGSYREPWMVLGRLIGLPTAVVKAIDFNMRTNQALGLFQPEGTLPLLVLGRDRAVGRLYLSNGRLSSSIDTSRNAAYYNRVENELSRVIHAMGAHFLPFPLWHFGRKIEVPHPLGGAAMSDSPFRGVVDDAGRVYGYENLVVLDGSIIPSSLGVNPALTIAAIAERAAEILIAQLQAEGRISPRP